ncbi:MAG: hypothetical protein M5U34_00085 [Chloroflexi bacterium]|nr:hypothetical protein [Chloroflexota bacterium]
MGVNVIGIIRGGQTTLAPSSTAVLQAGDRLLVVGRREQVDRLRHRQLDVAPAAMSGQVTGVETPVLNRVEGAVFSLMPGSILAGKSLAEADFRRRFGVNILAVRRNGVLNLHVQAQEKLHVHDKLIVQGNPVQIANLAAQPDFTQITTETAEFAPVGRKPPDLAGSA